MKRNGLFLKYFLSTFLVFLLAILLFALAFSGFSYRYALAEKREAISTTAEVAANAAAARSMDGELSDWELRIQLSSIAQAGGAHVVLCDALATVVSCSDSEAFCEHLGHSFSVQRLEKLTAVPGGSVLTDLDGFFPAKRYLAVRHVEDPQNGAVLGYVLAAADLTSIMDLWSGFIGIFALIASVLLLAVLALSWYLAARQVAPLRELAAAARTFGGGDLSARLNFEDRQDEFSELGEAFNQMAESLESAETQRREFIANISHELKTPMTTITGYADGLLDGTIPWEKRERYLTIISDETRRLSRLVRKMLDISRLQSSPEEALKKTCDICETLRMAILSLESRVNGKKLDVDVQIPDEGIRVRGEQDAITQICYNLLDNAVKFSYEGSTLTLRIWKSGTKAYVAVKNQGDEIAPDDLPYIFDRFHKSDKSRSMDKDGVGLGLYIVKSILTGYGENITVTSKNHETEFVFTLAAAQ